MIIPKVLAQNSGFDPQESIVKLQVSWWYPLPGDNRGHLTANTHMQDEYSSVGQPVGIDLSSGEAMLPADEGVWDNYRVKRQLLHSW